MGISTSFYTMLKQLYAADTFQGYTDKDITYLEQLFGTLPQVLEDYYRTAGHTAAFHHVQDNWILPRGILLDNRRRIIHN